MRDFVKCFFCLYLQSNFATRGNRAKGIKLLICATNFTDQKKINLKRIFGYFEQSLSVTHLPLL